MFDVYFNRKRDLLVTPAGRRSSLPIDGQASSWRKSKRRVKKVSAEIRTAIESQGYYFRKLKPKSTEAAHISRKANNADGQICGLTHD